MYIGKKSDKNFLVLGKDFEITGYTNNIRKGTAKVTVRGINGMAGTRTLTFKITQKKGSFIGVLLNGKWVQTPEQ